MKFTRICGALIAAGLALPALAGPTDAALLEKLAARLERLEVRNAELEKEIKALKHESTEITRGLESPRLSENEPELKELSFRDFETGSEYAVSVKTLSEGAGKDVRSSFYIVLSVTDGTGKKATRTVGLPGLKRPGVKDYLIRRIVTDDSGKSLVFVVEKKLADRNGDSVRFMVETCRM